MTLMSKFRFLVLLLVAVLLAQNARAVVVDFEDLAHGTIYNVGDSFTTSGVVVTAEQFQQSDSTWYAGGQATVQSDANAGGSGYEIHTNNINLSFDFGSSCDGVSLMYADLGGNINLEINGSLANVDNFNLLPPTLGGASIFTTPGDTGALFVIGVVGDINSFKIGGQELYIDNIVASVVPEPATVALLGAGALSLAIRRRRKLRKDYL
ncbi:MAG: PEP-CTERM sorting domain-containing protein [Planctomycetota bacterium]|nr:MAG: PEP-CTERM sorting domain-containing protein [Planctomycetota bacterium]